MARLVPPRSEIRCISSVRGQPNPSPPRQRSTDAIVETGTRERRVDPVLAVIFVTLIAFGVVMVYSASAVYAYQRYGSAQHYLLRQAVYALAGLALATALWRLPYRFLRRLTYPAFLGAISLLLVVLLFGHRAGGAARWIALGPIHIQPAEPAKLALILWLAYSLTKKREKIRSFSIGVLPHALVAGLLMVLCLEQPDFGSAVMIGLLTLVLLFAAGAKAGYLLGGVALAVPMGWMFVTSSHYRMQRIQAYLEPFEHRYGIGYQITESLLSFGAGGTWGVGIGDSRQKLFFLPEAHTDFIAAIVGEELGFAGVLALLIAFSALALRGLQIAFRTEDEYGAYLAVGISMFLGLQAFTNLAVATGMLPTKGLVLPFVSYGGSSLLVNSAAVGILLSISSEAAGARSATPAKKRVHRSSSLSDSVSGSLVTTGGPR